MTKEQILETVKKYDKHLKSLGIENENGCLSNFVRYPVTKQEALLHARWMCFVIELIVEEGKIEKAMRWLGFVQGVLFSYNIFTIEEMKDDNR